MTTSWFFKLTVTKAAKEEEVFEIEGEGEVSEDEYQTYIQAKLAALTENVDSQIDMRISKIDMYGRVTVTFG